MAQARNQHRPALGWTLALFLLFLTVFLLSLRIAGADPVTPDVDVTADLDVTLGDDDALAGELEDLLDELVDDADEPRAEPRTPRDDDDDSDHERADADALVGAVHERDRARAHDHGGWIGRLELSFAWRRTATAAVHHDLWLLATWSL